jgi:esterase/lipase superfamily enzyme
MNPRRYPRRPIVAIVVAGAAAILIFVGAMLFWVSSSTYPSAPPPDAGNAAPAKRAPEGPPPPPAPPTRANAVSVRVFFGTDRQPLEPARAVFADAPTDGPGELRLGVCEVSIPPGHRIGRIERPTLYSLHVSDWFETTERHFVITERPILSPDMFWRAMQERVGNSSEKQVLLFLHGYNVSFDDAVYRTAQLAFDLQFNGAAVSYSWPSNARTLRYVADKDHSMSTLAAFEKFLLDLSRQSGARTIHVIAHSMGNNTLVHGLSELALGGSLPPVLRFREIIMAAPDVDRREFLRLGDAVQSLADHITLYAADNDRAIGASDTLSGAPRVGDANPMFLRKGIDSIDASSVIKGFLKHSYFADSRILLDDIQRVLESHASPPRFGLAGIPRNDRADYWRFLQ